MAQLSLYLQAALYFAAGVYHFVNPAVYRRIIPPYLPAPDALVALSGLAEMALAVGLLFPVTRTWAAYGIIAMLAVFLIIHVDMLVRPGASMGVPTWALLVRLPLQGLLMWWAYSVVRG